MNVERFSFSGKPHLGVEQRVWQGKRERGRESKVHSIFQSCKLLLGEFLDYVLNEKQGGFNLSIFLLGRILRLYLKEKQGRFKID